MSRPVRVLGFAGSLRKGSYNRALLRAAGQLAPEEMSLEVFDLSPIPLYNADIEAAGVPEPVHEFKERIAAADALLIVTPEYLYSVPGVLKNALDWASRLPKDSPLNRKPVAITGAGGLFGTVRAQGHLLSPARRLKPARAPTGQYMLQASYYGAGQRALEENRTMGVRQC